MSVLKCVCLPPPPSIRVGRRLSAPAPPLQLPYFIRGHQLSSVLRCQSQTWVFSLLLSLHSFCRRTPQPLFLVQAVPQSSLFPSHPDFPLCRLTSLLFSLAKFPLAPALIFAPCVWGISSTKKQKRRNVAEKSYNLCLTKTLYHTLRPGGIVDGNSH